jgi:hypothetical protein
MLFFFFQSLGYSLTIKIPGMKKVYLSISLLIAGFISQAQINKGVVLLGGNFSAGTSKDKYDGANSAIKSNGLSFSPSYGRAIRDNLVVGFDLTVGYSTQGSDGNMNQENNYGAGFFVRKYKPLGSGFLLFGQTRVGFSYDDNQSDNSLGGNGSEHEDQRALSANLAFSLGIAYAVSRRWQLETSLPSLAYFNYSHTSTIYNYSNQTSSHDRGNTFGVGSTLQNYIFSLGLRYVIGG